MEKITLNNFTWGFELEGLFSRRLVDFLGDSGYNLELKDDGSVNIDNTGLFEVAEYENSEDDYCTVHEVALGVFDKFETMQEVLAKFRNGKNYLSNSSCGLHIHIKPKDSRAELKGICFDKELINNLEKYASSLLCEHIADRVKNNHYCAPEYTFRRLLRRYTSREKYAFMGNHPQGTIEFRFLSACNHKSQNVEKFFQYFVEQLNITQAKVFGKRTGLKTDLEILYNPLSFRIDKAEPRIIIKEDLRYNKKICV